MRERCDQGSGKTEGQMCEVPTPRLLSELPPSPTPLPGCYSELGRCSTHLEDDHPQHSRPGRARWIAPQGEEDPLFARAEARSSAGAQWLNAKLKSCVQEHSMGLGIYAYIDPEKQPPQCRQK